MVATTERPGRSGTSFSTSSGKVMRTATRWTTLVKLPVALSGGSSENCDPEAGEIDDTTPSTTLPPSASIGDVDLLPRLDVGELGLLEIGVDIGGVERHQRHQARARLHEVADLGRLVADDAVERRDDAGERQIALRLGERGHQFAALARRLVALGLQDVEIGFGAFQRGDGRGGARLGGGQRGGGAVAVGGRLFEPLLRAEIRLGELQRAVVFERGALDVGLGALQLRLRRLTCASAWAMTARLRVDLPAEAGDGRVLGVDPGLRRSTAF